MTPKESVKKNVMWVYQHILQVRRMYVQSHIFALRMVYRVVAKEDSLLPISIKHVFVNFNLARLVTVNLTFIVILLQTCKLNVR